MFRNVWHSSAKAPSGHTRLGSRRCGTESPRAYPQQGPSEYSAPSRDAGSRDFWVDRDQIAVGLVASLRTEAGKRPHDNRLTALVGELAARGAEFRERWASHDVYRHSTGAKKLNHPIVGELELSFEAMRFPADEDLTMVAYSAHQGPRGANLGESTGLGGRADAGKHRLKSGR